MATAYDLIVGALQNCGAYAIGEPPNAAFGSMGLRMLNQLRSQWNAEGVACFGLRVGSVAATGATSYTIGTGADIGIDVHGVRAVTVTESEGTTRELTRITFDEYMSLSDKTTAGEAQYYAADGLRNVFYFARTDPAQLAQVRDMAITGFSTVLTQFGEKAVTYDASGKIAYELVTPALQGILDLGGLPPVGWTLVKDGNGVPKAVRQ